MQLILASTSKYRRELLERLTPDFQSIAPEVDEEQFKLAGLSPEELAITLATEKSLAVASRFPAAIVIGSDQVAEINGQILGKPGTADAAVRQLQTLSGRTHRLLTAVSINGPFSPRTFVCETRLTMRSLTTPELERYVARDQPLDCGGSYRIESLGIALFESIQTADFTSIIGLPLMQLATHLRELGLVIP